MKHNIGRWLADNTLSAEVPTNIYFSLKEKLGTFNSFHVKQTLRTALLN
jgi:hypothetical protein